MSNDSWQIIYIPDVSWLTMWQRKKSEYVCEWSGINENKTAPAKEKRQELFNRRLFFTGAAAAG